MKAIAMKCTREKFDAVMKKLKKEGFGKNSVTSFEDYPYLFNNMDSLMMSNIDKTFFKTLGVEIIYETWNEQVFLEACGIEIKEKTFTITKDQLRELSDPKLRQWFPEVFEVKLEVGKWYKYFGNLCVYNEGNDTYGFWHGQFINNISFSEFEFEDRDIIKATEQEVFEALKNEAEKKGFVEGALCNCGSGCGNIKVGKLRFLYNQLYCNDNEIIMDSKGRWAELIPTCTRAEAEELLNKKIID